MLRLENIKIREELDVSEIVKYTCKKNGINFNEVIDYYIYKKSVDARNKEDIFYNFTIDIKVKDECKYKKVKKIKEQQPLIIEIQRESKYRPVIIGAGPARIVCCFNTCLQWN